MVYDPTRRLHEIVLGIADSQHTILDASVSFIEAHEAAVAWWAHAGDPAAGEKRLIVYLPMRAPMTPEARCLDPFSAIATASGAFLDNEGDSFQLLCENAKADHREKIRELFLTGVPNLATLEAVGGGNNWPQLQTLLCAESVTDLLVGLLAPTPAQANAMKTGDGWITEAKEMLEAQLGFVAKGKKKWESISDDLWRFILFSEFAYDLPQKLPAGLRDVPVARTGAEILVNRVCETLRQERTYDLYIERADLIATTMQLEERMRGVDDLGDLDTFAFEERSFLRRFVQQVLAGALGKASEIAAKRRGSIWVRRTDRGTLWVVAERARELLVVAEDLERDLPTSPRSTDELISFYTRRAYRVDQAQRELERALNDAHWELEGLVELVESAQERHRSVADKLQNRFADAIVKEGWPSHGHLRATQVFDRIVAPLLETRGKRVAYFMVDALRFELAAALERQLADAHVCRLQAVCAQLPTITPVGMAALLPQADGNLALVRVGNELVPTLARKQIKTPNDRRDYTKAIYGDRVRMLDLDEVMLLGNGSKKQGIILDGVELLLVKTTDIDEQGELAAANVCRSMPHILAQLIAAVGKLKKAGFHHVVIATDHGFALNASTTSAGNTLSKPPGDWLEVKNRCLLGTGSGGPDFVAVPKEHVGIAGDFPTYVAPRSFATFSKRHGYFHEGLSLPENVIPVLEVDLANDEPAGKSVVEIELRYRGESTGVVTTRRPMLDVSVFGGDLFACDVVFKLEVRSTALKEEKAVGEAASSPHVDPATGLVRLKMGQAARVPIRLDDVFVGAFQVRAVDAETGVIYGSPLHLKAEPIA